MARNRPSYLAHFALLGALAVSGTSAFAAPPQENRVFKPASQRLSALPTYAAQYVDFFERSSNATEKNLGELSRVANIVAMRHIAGGVITWPWNSQGLQQEMAGRSGGMVNFGPDRAWKDRKATGDAQNIVLTSWDRAPGAGELDQLKKFKADGAYLIAFGPRSLPALAEYVPLFDAWFDTGLGADDRVVTLKDGTKAGHGNLLANMLNGWTFEAELIAALTRMGKMPVMYQSYMVPEGKDWANKYSGKQFHDDLTIEPIAPGVLGKAFLNQIRENVRLFDTRQSANLNRAVALIVDEKKAGHNTVIASMGHSPFTYLGKGEETAWSQSFDLEATVPAHVEAYQKGAPEGALVLRIGYTGFKPDEATVLKDKKQRVILVSTQNPAPEAKIPADLQQYIDMEWTFGDASTPIAGYPIKVLPPSGIMQLIAFEAINVEVLAGLAEK